MPDPKAGGPVAEPMKTVTGGAEQWYANGRLPSRRWRSPSAPQQGQRLPARQSGRLPAPNQGDRWFPVEVMRALSGPVVDLNRAPVTVSARPRFPSVGVS